MWLDRKRPPHPIHTRWLRHKVAAQLRGGRHLRVVANGNAHERTIFEVDRPQRGIVLTDVQVAIRRLAHCIKRAGIILVRSNPLDIVKIIRLSRATYRKMIQNLIWATGYNVVAIPLAMGILAPVGITLDPAIGAVFMSVSTVIVAINAQLLRGLKLD